MKQIGGMMKQSIQIHISDISSNKKTGPIMVTTTSANSCPDNCPLKIKGGCYGDTGPISLHWNKVSNKQRGDTGLEGIKVLCDKIRKLPAGMIWRHNQVGDLPGINNRINEVQLKAIVRANNRRKGFTYTHKPMTPNNVRMVRFANTSGFTINLSGNNVKHADKLKTKFPDLPVVTMLPENHTDKVSYTPGGNKVVLCPAVYNEEKMNCARCKICAKPDRDYIVGFPVHGNTKKKAAVACKF